MCNGWCGRSTTGSKEKRSVVVVCVSLLGWVCIVTKQESVVCSSELVL